jgi:hypothetical protein
MNFGVLNHTIVSTLTHLESLINVEAYSFLFKQTTNSLNVINVLFEHVIGGGRLGSFVFGITHLSMHILYSLSSLFKWERVVHIT